MLTELSVCHILVFVYSHLPGKDTMQFQALDLRVEMFLSFGMS